MRLPQRLGAILGAGILSLTLATAAFAQQRAAVAPAPPAIVARLGLNADQEGRVKAAGDALQAELKRIMTLSTAAEKRAARKDAGEKYQAALKEVLTPDQQKKLDEMLAESRQFRGMGAAGPRMVGLGLTEEQKTKIKGITDKYAPEIDKLRASLKDATDKKAVTDQRKEVEAKMVAEIRDVLTPDQQKQFDESAPRRKKQQ